jgi:hypothetical protein
MVKGILLSPLVIIGSPKNKIIKDLGMKEESLKEVLIELQKQNKALLYVFDELNNSFSNQAMQLNVDFYNAYSAIYRPKTSEDGTRLLDALEEKTLKHQDILNQQRKEAKESIEDHMQFMDENLKKIQALD